MDDRSFDQKTAQEWINIIEDETANVREKDIYPQLNSWIDQIKQIYPAILDLGCGQGICSEKITRQPCQYVGIDPSPFLIERAKEKYLKLGRTFQVGNAYALPFLDQAFDAVFSIAVWHLLSDINQASRELSRVLKTQGHFLIITANSEFVSDWISPNDVLYLHNRDTILDSLRSVNFQVHHTETFRKFLLIKGQKT